MKSTTFSVIHSSTSDVRHSLLDTVLRINDGLCSCLEASDATIV
jgi:hypothetical protein